VLIGAFNPTIYQPAWFAKNGLIREEESNNAKVQVVHPEITTITIGSITIQIQTERVIASTMNAAEFEVLRDLIVGTFKTLPHTPINMLGINYDSHFKLSSEDAWHALGHRLAPKEPWANILDKPGMRSLTMESPRPNDMKGFIRVKVEPSTRLKFAAYININDHYQIHDHKPENGCEAIIEILSSSWNDSLTRSQLISTSLVSN
jgi:hypothetical protein